MSSLDVAEDIIKAAKSRDAEAEVFFCKSDSISVTQRLLKQEEVLQSSAEKVGIRVILNGKRSSCVSSDDFERIGDLVDTAVAIASSSPEDPYLAISDVDTKYASGGADDLALFDNSMLSMEEIGNLLHEVENAALSYDSKIVNSEGASFSYSNNEITLATSRGFYGSYKRSYFSTSVSVVASDDKMETDYSFSVKSHLVDLEDPKSLGEDAAYRALRKLKSREMKTAKVPVVFENRVASSLLRNFASAINGSSIADKSSFLAGKIGEKLFGHGINIVDDPLLVRGISSRPFDGEGVASRKNYVVQNGELKSWVLDMRTGKQLSLCTTANAIRHSNASVSPGVSNFYVEGSSISPQDLMSDIKNGLYVTDLFGFGVNLTTGDYSQGVFGFAIENGSISYPVSGVTIAGNLSDMFAEMQVANDLVFLRSVNSPTLRFDGMIVSGSG
ncbi:TldD/PmbA family protein [Anaplasma bovis]|uniref:TldD/PmbA family protein n=1 Tax=Anaplasma bovis TaxID=186733 RepID=UPI002FEFE677